MNGPMQNSSLRYQESLSKMSSPVFSSRLPKVKMNLKGLSRYAKEKGMMVKDLTEEEKNQFGVFTMSYSAIELPEHRE